MGEAVRYCLSYKRAHQLKMNPLPPNVLYLWDGFVTAMGKESQLCNNRRPKNNKLPKWGRPLCRVRAIMIDEEAGEDGVGKERKVRVVRDVGGGGGVKKTGWRN